MLDTLCAAVDAFKEIRRKYATGEASYQDMYNAAAAVLQLRADAEVKRYGKAKTKITPQTIASFMRS